MFNKGMKLTQINELLFKQSTADLMSCMRTTQCAHNDSGYIIKK